MRFRGLAQFKHDSTDRIGVLITNLGTPDEPTKAALRRYLKEFLSDPRVVEVPRPLWWLILNLVILNVRPARSAKAYQKVWSASGSPLKVHTQQQCEALKEHFAHQFGDTVVVDYAMRYGNPSIASVLQRMQEQGVRRLIVLPLYPQYCGATTASTFDAIAHDFMQRRWLPDLHFISHYADFEPYIQSVAEKIRAFQRTEGKPDQLIFSFHGVPKRYLIKGDPYFCECHKTARLIAESLQLQPEEYRVTFQSRFGREEWLKPYTDETLKSLPAQGVKSVQIVCPGFAADCLETLEEIEEENRDYFLQAGGEKYAYIPALNADAEHIEMLSKLIEPQVQHWLQDASRDSKRSLQYAQQQGAAH